MILGVDTVEVTFPSSGGGAAGVCRLGSQAERRGRAVGFGDRAWATASLATRAFGTNSRLLPITDVRSAVLDLVHEAGLVVGFSPLSLDPREIRIRRIDIAADLQSEVPIAHVLKGLMGLAHPSRTKVYPVLRNGGLESLRVGNGSWIACCYDKALKGGAADQFRVECQLRARRLTSPFAAENGGMVRVLADLTADKIVSLFEGTISLLGYHLPVALDHSAAMARLGWSNRDLVTLIGVLGMQDLGLYKPGSPNTKANHQRLVDRYRTELRGLGAPAVVLDWAAGLVSRR